MRPNAVSSHVEVRCCRWVTLESRYWEGNWCAANVPGSALLISLPWGMRKTKWGREGSWAAIGHNEVFNNMTLGLTWPCILGQGIPYPLFLMIIGYRVSLRKRLKRMVLEEAAFFSQRQSSEESECFYFNLASGDIWVLYHQTIRPYLLIPGSVFSVCWNLLEIELSSLSDT